MEPVAKANDRVSCALAFRDKTAGCLIFVPKDLAMGVLARRVHIDRDAVILAQHQTTQATSNPCPGVRFQTHTYAPRLPGTKFDPSGPVNGQPTAG